MGLGTVSVCLTVLVLNLHHRDAECPVPRWTRILVLNYLARLLCVRARKPKTMAGNLLLDSPERINLRGGLKRIARNVGIIRPVVNKRNGFGGSKRRECSSDGDSERESSRRTSKERRGDHTQEWKEVANVLDRLFFWIVFIFMTASAMIIVLVPYYKQELNP